MLAFVFLCESVSMGTWKRYSHVVTYFIIKLLEKYVIFKETTKKMCDKIIAPYGAPTHTIIKREIYKYTHAYVQTRILIKTISKWCVNVES